MTEIDYLKLKAEKEFGEGRVRDALASLDRLSFLLETEVAKPHQYHVQANQAARLYL